MYLEINPRYGMAGLVGYPYIVFVELIAPVVEMLGYVGFTVGLWLGWINWAVALFFLVAAWGVGLALSLFAILLEEISFQRYPRFGHTLWLMLMAMFEQFGYRQMTVWWRLKGIFLYFRGHQAWGHMKREGLETSAKAQSARP